MYEHELEPHMRFGHGEDRSTCCPNFAVFKPRIINIYIVNIMFIKNEFLKIDLGSEFKVWTETP
jgi:hypothetical protein